MNHFPKVDVFLSHSNPCYDSNITDESDAHRGFFAFNEYIYRNQPTYFIHGHLHVPFIDHQGDTTIHCVYPFLELEL